MKMKLCDSDEEETQMLNCINSTLKLIIRIPCTKFLQSCPTLCNPMDSGPPDSPVHGILQARILEWVAMPSSKGSSLPGDGTHVSYVFCVGRWVLYHQHHLGSSIHLVSLHNAFTYIALATIGWVVLFNPIIWTGKPILREDTLCSRSQVERR